MWFAVGFSLACAMGAYLLSDGWLLLFGTFCLIACVSIWHMQSPLPRKAVCVLLGCVIGFVWFWCFDFLYLSAVRQMDGQAVSLDIEITGYDRPSEYGITVEGKTELNGKTYPVQLYINESVTVSPDDRVEGGFVLRYTGCGAQKPTYHQGKGVFLLCYPKGENTVLHQDKIPVRYFAAVWRQKILSWLDTLFPEDTAPFAKALLLGDTTGLDYETKWAMKTAGVYHVVAVSGMHVSIVFALVYLLCGKQRILTAVIGLPALLLFAALAGFSHSIVRACIMQGLMILAMLVNKEYDPPTALAAAVLLILISNPLSITSVSLQLSAGCMIGIFLFTQKIHGYLLKGTKLESAKGKTLKARLVRWVVGSVSVTLGAMSLTTPLCAIYFGSVSFSGILTNLLILWMISVLFYGIIAACLLGAIWLPVGIWIGGAVSLPMRMILWVTDMISKLPVSAVYTSSIYIVAWLIFSYVLLTVFLKTKKKHPAVLIVCILAGLLGAVTCSYLEPRMDDYRVTAVDVGQGQCLLLQTDGKYYMVDCGGDNGDDAAEEATKLLLSQGIFRLDGLILTHYDLDHAGGALQLLSRIPADTVYLPILDGESDVRDALAERYADRIYWVKESLTLQQASLSIYPSSETQDDNESSLCILFQPENCDILITGDRSEVGERELMEQVKLPDLEILVAGHHGSRNSTSWELLNATRPEIVIISVGKDNSYGHPTWETLERLQLFGCSIYRTDIEGTIIFRG